MIIIATQDRTSNFAVTYEHPVSAAGSSYCASPRSRGVSEMKSWLPGKKRGGAREGLQRKQLGELRKKSVRLRKV